MEKQQELLKKLPTAPNLELERQAEQAGYQTIAGVDEAGRGPIAGPVVVAAVILGNCWNLNHPLNDSKKLSSSVRGKLFQVIRQEALAYRIVAISPKVIDQLNILQATLFGMKRAIQELKICPQYVLVDGKQYPLIAIAGEAVVKGDGRSCSIAAASILAKVARDRIMEGFDRIYPFWGFRKHKGYPTPQHRKAIEQHSLSPIHRHSFQCHPIPMKQQELF